MLEPGRRAAALVENLTDGILILDREGIIRWLASSAHSEALSPQELLGRSAGEALHGSDAPRFQAALNDAVAHPGTPVRVESLRQSGGRVGQADDTLTFLPDTEGINGVLLVTRSQPMRERLAHIGLAHIGLAHTGQLGESEEQLRQVVRLTHIGIFDHDHLSGEVYWSLEIRRIYGWGETEPVVVVDRQTSTANTWSLIHPQDRELVAAALRRAHARDGEGLFDVEYRIVRRDGELRWLSTRSQTLFEGQGSERHAVRTVGAVQDITARKQVERQIELMQLSVDRCNTAIYWVSSSGAVTYANECACQSLGMKREELVGLHVWEFDPDFPPKVWQAAWQRVKRDHYVTLQTRHRRKDGTLFPIDVLGTYIAFENEELVFVFAQDISERKQAERALRASEERLQQVALVYNIGLFEHDNVTNEVYWSPELRKYWGVGPADPVNLQSFQVAIHPDDQQRVAENIARAHDPAGDGRYNVQHRVIRRDNGETRWVDTRSQTFFEDAGALRHPVRTVGAMVDVTSRVMAEEALRHSLREKETLLREVHHRVKNNLQIISSLLHFQAKKVRNPEDLAAFAEGRNRLRSMILVHEKLYQSPDLSRIDFGSYIRALARDLQRSYLTSNVGVRVAADTLELPVESAVPCGMILCELLTNVFKYAFPDGRSGTAEVKIIAVDGHMQLSVSDDGIGLPGDFDPEQSSSFGWQLIRNLTAQLGGAAKVDRQCGTHVAISFPRHSGEP